MVRASGVTASAAISTTRPIAGRTRVRLLTREWWYRYVDRESHISSLLSWYSRAPEDVKDEGRGWYDAQRELIRELSRTHGIEIETIAAVVAALSPMTRWTQNVAGTIRLIRAFEKGPYAEPPRNATLFYKNTQKAWTILHGAEPRLAFVNSPKVEAFWRNLMGDENAVTVDTWMLRAMGEGERFVNGLKPKPYRDLADDIREAAHRVSETPAAFQAIVWVQIRREESRCDTSMEAA